MRHLISTELCQVSGGKCELPSNVSIVSHNKLNGNIGVWIKDDQGHIDFRLVENTDADYQCYYENLQSVKWAKICPNWPSCN